MDFASIFGLGTAHDPATCPFCRDLRAGSESYLAYNPAPQPFTLADLGLTDAEIESLGLGDEAEEDSELSRVINEVREGRYLLPDEGETLLQALVDEEQEHAETLADLGDAEDEIEALKGELDFKSWLLNEAGDALLLAANTIQSADSLIEAQRLYISFLEARIFEQEMTNRARVVYATLFI